METFPDYYAILNVSETATADEIREAYKRKALETHPDRYASGSKDSEINPRLSQEEAKIHFQKVADAYFVLSDKERRAQYDNTRATRKKRQGNSWQTSQANPDQVFGDVFEDLLRSEVDNPSWFYAPVGAVTGACLGFICGNVPGLIIGAYAGNKLGAIRDAKGMSVYDAYSRLNGNRKAAILAALASKLITAGRI
ncbi:DnaJ-domain-containing protein [Rhizophagus irregularis]|uniref:DnaJ domain-containing protein n=3 Tax=Rhizophagus irregularis TaxID=588596 RepID=U9T2C3_RHIID|nr:DnaJ domain-containing protein [Rhizophagus irregularis DAOM 181602=DAOM 197198]EXX50825.1 Jjj3p [Rhizophagus irregularis DAOM 197198w]PKC14512.1 DnaJ-domain-containing protein [Rhizophagus irregularis]RGB27608.1 DnaJ domain-containing protein [Rhizophagus diaphanus] [Rhizophagus sp. MUCL 43196]PKC58065.1 DnaJ-domain-containing protein [Rhizophagus irregularis]PKY24643.1 DnaJ-domain-containing protein [Rhizophagus irregularis]|eukprot:XP_025185728.1 DnaJ domain-containing protein [Rhizophagus irregularis DAOM 181602=DAOM 197198]